MTTISTTRRMARQLLRLRSPRDLAELLETRLHHLQLLALRPVYKHFSIPKPDGSLRYLEDPEPALKMIQRKLNRYLQAVYFFERTEAAYGFIIAVKRDPSPRNILTNTYQHLGGSYFYNADMEDFFHTIEDTQVRSMMEQAPFSFDEELAQLIAGLCCYQDRLPMGAPTSPVLSNFACKALDMQLADFSQNHAITFTRFADDMTFSSQKAFTAAQVDEVAHIVDAQGYRLNPEKLRHFGPEDKPEITGLRIDDGQVKLPSGFLKELEGHILRLKHLNEVAGHQRTKPRFAKKYHQKVAGMLAFASFILGDDHPAVLRSEVLLDQALHPDESDFGAMSWWEFGYR